MFSSLIKFLIRFYQLAISPFFAPSCRFIPSCSEYAIDGINQLGIKAIPKVIYRICRCHPWGGAGFDPFTEVETNETTDKPNFSNKQSVSELKQSFSCPKSQPNRSHIHG